MCQIHVHETRCPYCGRPELDAATNTLNIRALKVCDDKGWWSHCLKCDKWFLDN